MSDSIARAYRAFLAIQPQQQALVWTFWGALLGFSPDCPTCHARHAARSRRAEQNTNEQRNKSVRSSEQVSPGPPSSTQNSKITEEPRKLRSTAVQILNFLNQKTGHAYREVDANLRLIEARLASGVTESDCKMVISGKVRQWESDPKMHKFLRPATLFSAQKFEQYFGEMMLNPEADAASMPDEGDDNA